MTTSRRAAVLRMALAAMMGAGPASAAGWQGVAWGGKATVVAAAFPGRTRAPMPVDHAACYAGAHPGLVMRHNTAGHTFDVVFCFDDISKGLEEVGLSPSGTVNTFALESDLYARYGAHLLKRSDGLVDTIVWLNDDTEVTFVANGADKAALSYRARKRAGNTGL